MFFRQQVARWTNAVFKQSGERLAGPTVINLRFIRKRNLQPVGSLSWHISPQDQAAWYFPPRRTTWLVFVSAVRALETDISPDLSPFTAIALKRCNAGRRK